MEPKSVARPHHIFVLKRISLQPLPDLTGEGQQRIRWAWGVEGSPTATGGGWTGVFLDRWTAVTSALIPPGQENTVTLGALKAQNFSLKLT